jgi:indolepyruvate ferredoxin oxidoreductase
MLGFAFQKGNIPLSFDAIQKAIDLNGAAIDLNKAAFAWGRLAAHDLPRVLNAVRFKTKRASVSTTVDEAIRIRAEFLTAYQDAAYAARYRTAVEQIRQAERNLIPNSQELTQAFAQGLFKLMAYKDEYEVARLYTDGTFAEKMTSRFEGDYRLTFHLAPPLFAKRDRQTGHLRKQSYGPWVRHLFRMLAALKILRGTPFDPFGYTTERKAERGLIEEYSADLLQHAGTMTPQQLPVILQLANLAQTIRGFGHVKDRNLALYRRERQRLKQILAESQLTQAAE